MSAKSEPEAKTNGSGTNGGKTNQGRPVNGVALLLLAVAVVVGGITYGVASWQYRSVVELKDAIASAQATTRNFDAGLASLRAENADLRARLTTAEAAVARSQRRDPDAIYQLGAEVGRVAGAREDRASSMVTFESIDGGSFDGGKEFEYRDLTLVVKNQQSAMTSFTGRGVQTQLTGVEATIVRTRAAP